MPVDAAIRAPNDELGQPAQLKPLVIEPAPTAFALVRPERRSDGAGYSAAPHARARQPCRSAPSLGYKHDRADTESQSLLDPGTSIRPPPRR